MTRRTQTADATVEIEDDEVSVVIGFTVPVPDCTRPHCDAGDCMPCERDHVDEYDPIPKAHEALKRWHDEDSGHSGPFQFCYLAPCRDVRDALTDW